MTSKKIIKDELERITKDAHNLSEQLALMAVNLKILTNRIHICVEKVRESINTKKQK